MDIEAILRKLSKYIFIGIVSQYGKTKGTVIVTRPDQDDRTTAELYILSRCTKETKDWWMPDIGEAVMCVCLPNTNGKGPGEGFVLGAHYSEKDAPAESDTRVRSIRYKDGRNGMPDTLFVWKRSGYLLARAAEKLSRLCRKGDLI